MGQTGKTLFKAWLCGVAIFCIGLGVGSFWYLPAVAATVYLSFMILGVWYGRKQSVKTNFERLTLGLILKVFAGVSILEFIPIIPTIAKSGTIPNVWFPYSLGVFCLTPILVLAFANHPKSKLVKSN